MSNRKFSLIIPTMWKFKPFIKFLGDLIESEYVGEVIIINNNRTETPITDVLQHSKITVYDCNENIGVNPAWNLGVSVSKFDLIGLINDDIVFDLRVFKKIETILNVQMGAIGFGAYEHAPLKSGIIDIVVSPSYRTFGWGGMIFLHKDSWIPVPSELKYFYGDDWILETNNILSKRNYLITDMLYHTVWATTSGFFNCFYEPETTIYVNKIQEFRKSKESKS